LERKKGKPDFEPVWTKLESGRDQIENKQKTQRDVLVEDDLGADLDYTNASCAMPDAAPRTPTKHVES